MVVHHINGVKWDNRPSNLQTINQELNVAYAIGRPIVASCVRGDGGVVMEAWFATSQWPHAADFLILYRVIL
jgi:hypothetical protein